MLFDILSFLSEAVLLFALHLGNSGFPRPLTAAEEREHFLRLRDGDAVARDALIRHNLRLVAHVAKKYYAATGDNDDLISIGTIGLIKAVDTYRSDHGSRFATYAARCIDNEILMTFRQAKKERGTLSLSEPLEGEDGGALSLIDVLQDDTVVGETLELQGDILRLRELVEGRLSPRERRVVKLRYGLDGRRPLTQQQTAAALGISRSYVSRIEKKALLRLRAGLRD